MDHQEIFNTVLFGIRGQGGPAWEDGNGCRYRTDNGRRCALGQFIPADQYFPALEGDVPLSRWQHESLRSSIDYLLTDLGLDKDVDFLKELQRAHDTAAEDAVCAVRKATAFITTELPNVDTNFFREWEFKMSRIAAARSLVYTPVQAKD